MEDKKILTDEEKRFLYLSAQPKLGLREKLEFAKFKKEQNYKRIQEAERFALTAGILSTLMLSTIFMPSSVLPVTICFGHLGYLAYLEQGYFKKVKAKAYYYFCVLNAEVNDEKYQTALNDNRQKAFNRSDSFDNRARAVHNFSKQLEKIDLDRQNAEGRNLKEAYYAIPRFRAEILTLSAISLVAGAFLPQMAFFCVAVGFAGLSSVLAKIDANMTRKKRFIHWKKKEERLKKELQKKMQAFEHLPILDTQNQLKKISHKERVKSDNTHQRDD